MTKIVKFIQNRGFWFALLILPIITYAFTYLHNPVENTEAFKGFLEGNYAFTATTGFTSELYSNVSFKEFLDSLNISQDTFYTAGYLMNWIILIECIHMITDVVLMLPRLIQKGFRKMGLGDE